MAFPRLCPAQSRAGTFLSMLDEVAQDRGPSRCCLVAKSCLTLWDPWSVAYKAPLSLRFPGQEYWSGLPFLSPGDLSGPGIEPVSPALAGGFFTTEPPGKPYPTPGNAQNTSC